MPRTSPSITARSSFRRRAGLKTRAGGYTICLRSANDEREARSDRHVVAVRRDPSVRSSDEEPRFAFEAGRSLSQLRKSGLLAALLLRVGEDVEAAFNDLRAVGLDVEASVSAIPGDAQSFKVGVLAASNLLADDMGGTVALALGGCGGFGVVCALGHGHAPIADLL